MIAVIKPTIKPPKTHGIAAPELASAVTALKVRDQVKHAEQNASASRNIVRFAVPATVIVVAGLLSAVRSRGCRLDACMRREKRMGGSATQHTLHCGYAGRRPPGTARRRWEMLSRPTRVDRDTVVCHTCVRCGLARRVRHPCHHGQPAWVAR